MRRLLKLSAWCLAASTLAACTPEDTFETEDIPTAGVRFIHAVPDTGAFDFRPVDIVENSTFYNVTFRSTTLLFYKNARAGSRNFRIFLNGTTAAVASQVIKDTTVNLEAGKRYTFILWGYARTGSNPAMKLTVLEDDPADPGANVALRVVNATGNPIDASHYVSTGAPPATPVWANVAPLTASAYVTTAPGTLRYNVRAAGGTNPLFADPTAVTGSAATVDLEALPGTSVPGSAVSLFVFPGSVPGSQAPNLVLTTGATSLSATATGYARAAGSFITNGFVPGMQINATGFANAANNGLSTITAVTATTLTVTKAGGTVAEAAGANRTLVTSPPPPGAISVWDRRPPRAPGL